MVNNAKNCEKTEGTAASPKSKISQKELQKRVKEHKSPNNDSIAKSMQLIPKSVQPNEISKQCAIVKPLPSLKDLEKMYDDFDEEDDVVAVKSPAQLEPNILEQPTSTDNELLNCTMQANITNNSHKKSSSPTEKFIDLTFYDLPDLLPPTDPSRNISITTKENPKNEQIECSIIDLDTSDNTSEIFRNTTKSTSMVENINCISSDSNKTVDYNLSLPIFCPLPSTSHDNNTIIKNDKLFYESLKNASFKNNDSMTSDSDLEKKSMSIQNDQDSIDIDDDCIIINNTVSINKNVNSTDSIKLRDINIKSKKTVVKPNNLDDGLNTDNSVIILDEPMDIDALIIADNQSMFTKYKNSQNKKRRHNSVVDVSLECVQHSNSMEPNQMHTLPTSKHGAHNQNNSQEVLFVSETLPRKSRKIADTQSTNKLETTNIVNTLPIDTQNQSEVGSDLIHEVQSFLDRYKQNVQETEKPFKPISSTDFLSNLIYSTPEPEPVYSSCSFEVRQTSTNTNTECTINNKPEKKKYESTTEITSTSVSSYTPSPTRNLGDCPICMDSFSGRILASTICGHVFCMPCLEMSVKTSKRCPTCRKILKNKLSYHQIFL